MECCAGGVTDQIEQYQMNCRLDSNSLWRAGDRYFLSYFVVFENSFGFPCFGKYLLLQCYKYWVDQHVGFPAKRILVEAVEKTVQILHLKQTKPTNSKLDIDLTYHIFTKSMYSLILSKFHGYSRENSEQKKNVCVCVCVHTKF